MALQTLAIVKQCNAETRVRLSDRPGAIRMSADGHMDAEQVAQCRAMLYVASIARSLADLVPTEQRTNEHEQNH